MSRLAIAGVSALVLLALGAILFGGPIAKWYKQRAVDAEARQEHATDDAAARGLEVEGTETLATAAAEEATASENLRIETHVVEIRTRQDPAVIAAPRLPAGELARLRAHDRQLCDGGKVVCRPGGGSAPAGDPGDGARALQP